MLRSRASMVDAKEGHRAAAWRDGADGSPGTRRPTSAGHWAPRDVADGARSFESRCDPLELAIQEGHLIREAGGVGPALQRSTV